MTGTNCGCAPVRDLAPVKFHAPAALSDNMAMTPEGYLLCRDVAIARTGTMLYGAAEVTELEPLGDIVRVERDAEEVFKDVAMASFEGKPVTDDHPDEDVTPANWKRLAVGITQNVRRGVGMLDNLLLADLLITDKAAIDAVRDGKREVSCGYDAKFEQLTPGRGRQKDIIGNHVALVDRGRCGARCAIKDKETTTMTTKNWKDKLKAAFTLRDESALDAAMAEAEGGGNGVHVHVGDAKPATTNDAKFDALVGTVSKLSDAVTKLVKDAEEKKEKEEEDKTEDKRRDGESEEEFEKRKDKMKDKRDKAKDSALVEDSLTDADALYAAVVSRAEILAPGSTKDLPRLRKEIVHDSGKVRDGLCIVKRAALGRALAHDASKKALAPFMDGQTVDGMSCSMVDAAFMGASEIVKAGNNGRANPRVNDAGNGGNGKVLDAWKKDGLDAINKDFWAKRDKGAA